MSPSIKFATIVETEINESRSEVNLRSLKIQAKKFGPILFDMNEKPDLWPY